MQVLQTTRPESGFQFKELSEASLGFIILLKIFCFYWCLSKLIPIRKFGYITRSIQNIYLFQKRQIFFKKYFFLRQILLHEIILIKILKTQAVSIL